jgi:glucose-1-phosphate adenylyltransferase
MKRTMAVILAGGEGERLSILSGVRAKPAVPFGGKYRIIDFTLSNCVNSDVDNVVVLTQYNPRSLNDHIGLGRPWDLDRNRGGVKMLQPYIARGRVAEWYRGTADAVLQNINVIEHDDSDTVLILAGDHIYKMDYQPFLAAHRRKRADVTIAVRHVPLADASRMGVLALDDSDRVIDWQEKPKQPKSDLASMGVYVFSKKALRRWLGEDRIDFGRHVIPAMLEANARVFGYRYEGYWQDVGTIQSFWEANLALLQDLPELDLYDKGWVIHTRSEERAPAKIGPTAQVHRSLISHGCLIDGTVVNSVLSPGVRVDVGAVVRDSIVMFDCVIRSGAVVDRSILDKEVVVGQGAIVGDGPDFDTPNRQEPGRLNTGITVVGKRAIIPRGARIGRNVKVAADVRATDFLTKVVKNGASVETGGGRKKKSGRATAAAAPSSSADTKRAEASVNGFDSAVPVGAGASRAGRRAARAAAPEA